jgi:hypothetical protein
MRLFVARERQAADVLYAMPLQLSPHSRIRQGQLARMLPVMLGRLDQPSHHALARGFDGELAAIVKTAGNMPPIIMCRGPIDL